MIPSPLADPGLEASLASLEPDGLSLFTLGSPDGPPGGELRGALASGTRLVNQMRANHGLGIIETFVLGQAYIAAGLVASTLKGEDSLGLRLECDGALEGWTVAARAEAGGGFSVRGYLFRDSIPLEAPLERFDTAPLVGQGTLTMTRFIAGAPRPFTGTVSLKTGRLAEDLASYFFTSEQTPTAFVLGVHFDRAGRVVGAGGLYLQALPGATAATVTRAESALAALPPLGLHFSGGGTSDSLLGRGFAALGFEPRGRAELSFSCSCARERFGGFIEGAEGGLLEELATDGPWPVEAVCHQCGSKYHWRREELEAMVEERRKAKTGK